jgi:hypothetical protein
LTCARRPESRIWTPDALIVASRAGTPLNLNNWRSRTFNPAALSVGVPWATPYMGRHTYISLQIHAGISLVIVVALAGNSPEVIWKHYAREFDRARTAPSVPLADALATARARGVANVLPSPARPPARRGSPLEGRKPRFGGAFC